MQLLTLLWADRETGMHVLLNEGVIKNHQRRQLSLHVASSNTNGAELVSNSITICG